MLQGVVFSLKASAAFIVAGGIIMLIKTQLICCGFWNVKPFSHKWKPLKC